MSYSTWVSILLNGTVALAISFIVPRVTLNQLAPGRERIPAWILALAAAMILVAGKQLFALESSLQGSLQALLLSAAALGGIAVKWALTIMTSRARSLHEKSLLQALLFSPLGLLWVRGVAPDTNFSALAACWFVNGFFWQALFDDTNRIFGKQPPV